MRRSNPFGSKKSCPFRVSKKTEPQKAQRLPAEMDADSQSQVKTCCQRRQQHGHITGTKCDWIIGCFESYPEVENLSSPWADKLPIMNDQTSLPISLFSSNTRYRQNKRTSAIA